MIHPLLAKFSKLLKFLKNIRSSSLEGCYLWKENEALQGISPWRETRHLDLYHKQAMVGHTQTESTFHLTRTIIPIMGTFRFVFDELCKNKHSAEQATMTVTFS